MIRDHNRTKLRLDWREIFKISVHESDFVEHLSHMVPHYSVVLSLHGEEMQGSKAE